MKFRHPILTLFALVSLTVWLSGCGGGGSSPPPTPPAISVAFSTLPPTSLAVSATANITAVVSNDSKGAGVNWTVTCGSSACGSFSPTSTASGSASVYTAPSSVPSSNVTITATSVSDSTKTATASITITGSVTPPISVTFSPAPPTALTYSTNANLTAVVTNDSKNGGVNWTVTCGSSLCGTFNPAATASGSATIYTAPSAVPTGNTVTVTATSVTDSTKSASATITISGSNIPITIMLSPTPPTTLLVGATSNLTAVVNSDSKNAGVTWTATCGSSSCGSFSPTGTASGAATVYTAPSTIPSPNTVTVTATSVTDTTKTASATITINPILADGTYVYNFSGVNPNGRYFVVGAMSVKGSVITGGEQDFSDPANGYTNPIVVATSNLSVAGGNIQIVIDTGNTSIGVSGLETLRGTVVSSTRTLISEFDTYAGATGSIDLQTSTPAPSGGYAFAVSGQDNSGYALGIGGVLNINGTALSTSNSIFDFNDGGGIGQGQNFASGSVTAPDSFGRVTFSLTPSTASGVPAFVLTGYIVNGSRTELVESQADAQGSDLGGTALSQGTNTNNFNPSMLVNTSYAYSVAGADSIGPLTFAGKFTFNASGVLAGQMTVNDLNSFLNNTLTGTYTVDPTGRGTLNNVVPSGLSNANFTFQFYLDGSGNALVLGVDDSQVTEGPSYLQTATSADFEGNYALVGSGYLQGYPFWGAVGPVTVASDIFSGYTDYTVQGSKTSPTTALAGNENNSASLLSLSGLNASSFTTSYGYTYYPIDSSRVFAIESDGQSLGLLTFEAVSH